MLSTNGQSKETRSTLRGPKTAALFLSLVLLPAVCLAQSPGDELPLGDVVVPDPQCAMAVQMCQATCVQSLGACKSNLEEGDDDSMCQSAFEDCTASCEGQHGSCID